MGWVGGSRSTALLREAALLFHWAENRLILICAEQIRDRDNWGADWLSRQEIQPGEWCLNWRSFEEIVRQFRTLEVYLFASHLNHQLPRFFLRYYHFRVEAMYTLTLPWLSGLLYAFPPIPLIPKVIRKIKQQRARIILVAPWWSKRLWLSMLHVMSVHSPLHLTPSADFILHPHPQRLHLTAWLLNEDNC